MDISNRIYFETKLTGTVAPFSNFLIRDIHFYSTGSRFNDHETFRFDANPFFIVFIFINENSAIEKVSEKSL